MKQLIPFLAALTLTGPVAAQSPMSGAEFDAYTQGKTLYFESGGVSYGVEEYLPGRRVRWSFLDGDCKEGEWYTAGPEICFEYDDGTGPQCWTFFRDSGGLRAFFQGDESQTALYEARQGDEPMVCLGPKIGV